MLYQKVRYTRLDEESFQLRHLFLFMTEYSEEKPRRTWSSSEITAWLRENLGEPGIDNIAEYRYTHWSDGQPTASVIFRDDIDAVAFKMRFL